MTKFWVGMEKLYREAERGKKQNTIAAGVVLSQKIILNKSFKLKNSPGEPAVSQLVPIVTSPRSNRD